MKKLTLLLLNLLAFYGFSQNNDPVSWEVVSVEIAPLTYKVQLHATIKAPYHIYPPESSGGGLGMPTEIVFTEDSDVEFIGKMEENGIEDTDGKRVAYYKRGVTFSQMLRLKSDVPLSLSITVKYMACNDLMCLPPSTKQLKLTINDQETNNQKQDTSSKSLGEVVTAEDYENFDVAYIGGNFPFASE